MGFRVVLDGFDGNYMELSALGDIGTDVLKLDLCSAEMQNRTNALPGIFVQARTLRLNLLAEGIESASSSMCCAMQAAPRDRLFLLPDRCRWMSSPRF